MAPTRRVLSRGVSEDFLVARCSYTYNDIPIWTKKKKKIYKIQQWLLEVSIGLTTPPTLETIYKQHGLAYGQVLSRRISYDQHQSICTISWTDLGDAVHASFWFLGTADLEMEMICGSP
jgi:hypothetical protein